MKRTKVEKAGVMVFANSCGRWQFHMSGWEFENAEVSDTEKILAALHHVAANVGVRLVVDSGGDPLPSLDVERQAADVIAMARWDARGDAP